MKFLYLALFLVHPELVWSGILGNFTSSITDGTYTAVRTTVFTAQEVVGKPIELKNLKFFAYNSLNRGLEQTFDPLIPQGLGDAKGKIFFLVHGWFHTKRMNPWYAPLTNSLLSRYPDANVVQVDWETGSTQEYSLAAFSTESVGKLIAELMHRLMTTHKIPLKNFVCIGHSLGGQICGWAGRFFQEMAKEKLHRIVALDPAGPLFSYRPDSKRLNANDANVVQVIHSDGGKLGFKDPCGTIDFFPNGGSDQPGCMHIDLRNPLKLAEPVYCDHERAYDYYSEAVASPTSFVAKKCSNLFDLESRNCNGISVTMGDLETTERGIFYLQTNSESPFSNSGQTTSQGGSKFNMPNIPSIPSIPKLPKLF